MANRIRGITVEIGGDTTKLDKAIGSVNAELNNTKKNLRDVENLLKIDPTNVELLQQKEKLLAQATEQSAKKVETLKEAINNANQAAAEGNEELTVSQEQMDAMQRELIDAQNEYNGYKDASKKCNAQMDTFASKANKVASAAEKVAEKTKAMSTIAGGALAGLVGLAVKAGTAADDLNTLSKQTGISTQTLQEWTYASDLVDVSIDDITSAAAKMEKAMVSNSAETVAAWDKLGISVKDQYGNLRDVESVFNDVLRGLSNLPNEVDRDTTAMTLFGKSANELAGIVDDGGEALRTLGQEAEDAGLIMSQDALDKANQFNDGLDRLKATAKASFMEAGASLTENFLPFLEDLVEVGTTVLEWIGGLDTKTLKMATTALVLVAAITPIATMVASVAGAISGVTGAIKGVSEVGKLFSAVEGNAVYLTFAKWAIIILAVVAAFTALLAVIGVLMGKSGELTSTLNSAMGRTNTYNTNTATTSTGVQGYASGGVFMPNSPTLGILGDNTSEREVAAPESTLREIFNDALDSRGGSGVNITFGGSLAQLGRVLQPVVSYEGNRRGTSFTGR